MTMTTDIGPEREQIRRAGVAIAVGLAFATGVLLEIPYFNGSWYWQWDWRTLGVYRTLLFLSPPFVLVALALRRTEEASSSRQVREVLVLLSAGCFLGQLCAIAADPDSWDLLRSLVISPSTTSYYTDAVEAAARPGWLSQFHRARLALHSSTHPPGPILFYTFWIRVVGPEAAVYAGPISIGALASLGVWTLYHFGALWTTEVRPRLVACGFYSLLPALLLFLPEFDQVYPILLMLLLRFWVDALRGQAGRAVAFGLVLFVTTLFAYNLLVTGASLVMFSAFFALREMPGRKGWARIGTAGFLGLASALAAHALLWSLTGYQAVASFLHALANQKRNFAGVHRPYVDCLVYDLADFFLGSGMLAVPLLFWRLRAGLADLRKGSGESVFTVLGVLTILIVDLSGLLRGETARVWLFLQPFVALPAGMELARYSFRLRFNVLFVQWLVVVALKSKLWFVQP